MLVGVVRSFMSRGVFDLVAGDLFQRSAHRILYGEDIELFQLAINGAGHEGDEVVVGERFLRADHVGTQFLDFNQCTKARIGGFEVEGPFEFGDLLVLDQQLAFEFSNGLVELDRGIRLCLLGEFQLTSQFDRLREKGVHPLSCVGQGFLEVAWSDGSRGGGVGVRHGRAGGGGGVRRHGGSRSGG